MNSLFDPECHRQILREQAKDKGTKWERKKGERQGREEGEPVIQDRPRSVATDAPGRQSLPRTEISSSWGGIRGSKQADCCYLQPHSLGPYRVSGRRLRPSALPTWGWWGRWRVLLSWLSLVPRFLPQESGSIMLTRRPYPHPKVILLFIKPGLPDKSRGPHVAIIAYIFFSPKKCSIPSTLKTQ